MLRVLCAHPPGGNDGSLSFTQFWSQAPRHPGFPALARCPRPAVMTVWLLLLALVSGCTARWVAAFHVGEAPCDRREDATAAARRHPLCCYRPRLAGRCTRVRHISAATETTLRPQTGTLVGVGWAEISVATPAAHPMAPSLVLGTPPTSPLRCPARRYPWVASLRVDDGVGEWHFCAGE